MVFGLGPTRRLVSIDKKPANGGMVFTIGEVRCKGLSVYTKITDKYGDNHSSAGRDFYYLSSTDDQENKGAKEWLFRLDVYAQGPISGYKHFIIDNDRHNWARYTSKAYVQIFGYHGEAGQTAFSWDSEIYTGRGSNHKGVDVAYSVNRFLAHGSKPKFKGEPPCDAVLYGYPLYDPRLDAGEGGAGTHQKGVISTYQYSSNAALGLLTYLSEGVGAAWGFDVLDLGSFKIAADFCGQSVSSPPEQVNDTGAPVLIYDEQYGEWFVVGDDIPWPDQPESAVNGYQGRVVASLKLDPEDTVKTNIEKCLRVMHGHLPFSNGKYKLIIEDEVSSADMSFDDDSILGNWKLAESGRKERLNRATVTFINQHKDHKEDSVSWPKLSSAEYTAFLAEDNGESLHQTFDIEGVPDYHQATAWAELTVRDSRSNRNVTVDLAPKAMLLEYGDVLDITSNARGWINKWFRVRKVILKTDGTCTVEMVEYDGTIYPWSTKEPEPLDAYPDEPSPWMEPGAITGLAATPIHEVKADGSVISGFDVSWNEPTDTWQIDFIEVAWRVSATIDWKNISRVPVENTSMRITPLQDDEDYDIRVTYRTALGQVSAVASLLYQTLSDAESRLSGVEDGATAGDPYGASYNLLGSDAGPEHSYTTGFYNYYINYLLSDLGLSVGDILSFSADVKTDGTAGEAARIGITVRDGASGFLDSITASPIGSVASTVYEGISAENYVIPAGTVYIHVWAYWSAGSTGTKYSKNAMLNRGPVALPYVAPYADGADVTSENTAANTNNVAGITAGDAELYAQTGWDLTQFNGVTIDPSSLGTMDLEDLDPTRQVKLDGVATGADVTDYGDTRVNNTLLPVGGMIADPDFAKSVLYGGEDYWDFGGGSTIVAGVGLGGGDVLRCSGSGVNTFAARLTGPSAYLPIKEGDTIVVRMRARQSSSSNAVATNWRLELHARNASGGSLAWPDIFDSADLPKDDTFHEYERVMTITDANTFEMRPYFYNGTGFSAGYIDIDYVNIEHISKRVAIGFDDNGRIVKNFSSDVGILQGVGSRVLPRGVWANVAYDGVPIDFPRAYDGPPIVVFQDGGLTQSTALNGTVSPSKAPLSLSASGFTPSLRLKESAGAPVLRTETGAAGGTQDFEIDKASTGEAWDDRYTFQFDAVITNLYIGPGEYEPGWADIGIYTNNGAGWILRRTVRVAGGGAQSTLTRSNNVTTVMVDGLTNHGGREFGVSTVDSLYGGGVTSFDSVKYETATAPSDISSTPPGVSGVPFFVMEGEEA